MLTRFASETNLSSLNLRKRSTLKLLYDFGDQFYFKIKVEEIKKCDHKISIEDAKILEGKGYGIWEDAHYEMELYYYDRSQFYNFAERNGVDPDEYPIHEQFNLKDQINLKDQNHYLVKSFNEIKDVYEQDLDFPF